MGDKTRVRAEEWVSQHGDALYRYALGLVRDPVEAEELVQETFLAALKSSSGFKGRSSVRTWLTGILRHKIFDHFRHQTKRLEIESAEEDVESDLFDQRGRWLRAPGSWPRDPHKILEDAEFQRVLKECVDGLSPLKRAVFFLRISEGLSGKEICKVLEITPTHTWVLAHRARGAIRRCLDERWFGEREC
ncbi:MAG: sigma-70 family RNA polymerase sigma factor [Acidobacteriota bacterium]